MPLTPESRQALGEYIVREQRKGRKEMPIDEIAIAVRAIKAALGEPDDDPEEREK